MPGGISAWEGLEGAAQEGGEVSAWSGLLARWGLGSGCARCSLRLCPSWWIAAFCGSAGVWGESQLSMEDSHSFPHPSPGHGVGPALGAHRWQDTVSNQILWLCLAGEQHLCATAGPGAPGWIEQLTQGRAGEWHQENCEKMNMNVGHNNDHREKAPPVPHILRVLQSLGQRCPSAVLGLCWHHTGERGGFHSSRKISGVPAATMNILDRKLL